MSYASDWHLSTLAGIGVQGWTRTACCRACCVLISRLCRLLPGMQGFRLTGSLTGLLPLVAFCILKQSYATFWGSNEVALQFISLAPHSDRHPISASLHCQLSGRPTRTAVYTSINILTVSSRFLVACDSCQHCTSAVALTYHIQPSHCCNKSSSQAGGARGSQTVAGRWRLTSPVVSSVIHS